MPKEPTKSELPFQLSIGQSIHWKLRWRFLLATVVVSLIALGTHWVVQQSFSIQAHDAKQINIAGRQRMLGQSLVKAMLLDRPEEMKANLDAMLAAQQALREGDANMNLPGDNTQEMQQLFDQIEPHLSAIEKATHQLIESPDHPDTQTFQRTILDHEDEFLALMDEITHLYEDEAVWHMREIQIAEYLLLGVMLAGLAFICVFLFEQAVRAIHVQYKELRESQRMLIQLAHFDPLTGMPNRGQMTKRIEQAINDWRADSAQRFAVLFFDFDFFKNVNDSLGHPAGDVLLLKITERFEKMLRGQDMVARFGGDEFVLLLTGLKDEAQAETRCRELLDMFAEPHEIMGRQVVSTASIGVVYGPGEEASAEALIRDADTAMYQAKLAGRSRYHVFNDELRGQILRRADTEEAMRHAIDDNQLEILYQPMVSMEEGSINGFEALLRWDHPVLGRIGPDQFIPIAEETGMIVELGQWVLRAAMKQARVWRQALGPEPTLRMHINVSRRQLIQPDFVNTVREIMTSVGADPGDILLEITESTMMDERNNVYQTMQQLRDLGVALAMDDFGTGYSSLSCLHKFPVDEIKIDRSFVQHMEKRRKFSAVVHAIITLAKELGLEIVAEGVEDQAQLIQLQAMGCDTGQGYYFAKPLTQAEAEAMLFNPKGLRRCA